MSNNDVKLIPPSEGEKKLREFYGGTEPRSVDYIMETNYNQSEIERMRVETELNKSKTDFLSKAVGLDVGDPSKVDIPLIQMGPKEGKPEMTTGLLVLLGGAVYYFFIRKKGRK